ncbi:MAG TPA: long-chain fatty acid--CoA ligase [Acidimicrobiales bacterium]|nr:long-chain fatty acid--CoA ligase [Acidimicrobiales bacterium]
MSQIHVDARTIVDALGDTAQKFGDRPALRRRAQPGWETITWAQYAEDVRAVSAALEELSIVPGDRVAILSNNRPEWHMADLGIMSHGNVTVPLYPTSSPEQIAYFLGHSESRLCFVENSEQLAKVLSVKGLLPGLDEIVVFSDDPEPRVPSVSTFEELTSLGSERLLRQTAVIDKRARCVGPDDVATLVYTSGTTGPPKAAIILHRNIIWTLRSVISMFDISQGERFLSFLPLSHVAERMMSDFAPIVIGGETWFARNLGTVAKDLVECKPTLFFAVPRIWEKFRETTTAAQQSTEGQAREYLNEYLEISERVHTNIEGGGQASSDDEIQYNELDRTVGALVRERLGLDQARILISSAAPIQPGLLHWLHVIGLPVLELYGQTETCGPTTCNPPGDNRIGTVGVPIPGCTVHIADDGEVLVRGGNVCEGYFRDPQATTALIDEEGWMHSGDTGEFDGDGYLLITGRKKDLIITAAGQNIAPQEIEMSLRSHELISEAVVIGDGRRYLTALFTLDAQASETWARRRGKDDRIDTLASDPDVTEEVNRFLRLENARRSRVEQVRNYRILPHDFTEDAGELTPTLKVKRQMVNEKYRELIEEMYGHGA